jgi:release factor glutamine methyltransferase
MLTILDVVRRTTIFFEKCGVPQPQLDAEWIIAHSFVSNPPYLSNHEWECTQPEVREYDPKLALVSENEGGDILLHILATAKQYLQSGGLLAMETGELHHELLIGKAREQGYSNARGMRDLSKKPRFFLANRP